MLNDFFNKYLFNNNLSLAQLGYEIGFSEDALKKYRAGSRKPKEDFFEKMFNHRCIARYLDELTEIYMRTKIGNTNYELMMHYFSEARNFTTETSVLPPPKIYKLFIIVVLWLNQNLLQLPAIFFVLV